MARCSSASWPRRASLALNRVIALRTLLAYLIGALSTEHLGPRSGPGPDVTALAQLPPTDFPYLAETAKVARHITADDEFHRGLAAVMRGLHHLDGTVDGPARRRRNARPPANPDA